MILKYFNLINVIEATDIVDQKDIDYGTKGETQSRNKQPWGVQPYVMEKVRNCPVVVVPNAELTLLKRK
jgi:hypothetical protein